MKTQDIKNIMRAWQEVVEKKTLDPVDHKALKGAHADRKDKDIDNDGDVDSSDEYLHKRRKAVSKSMKNESEDEKMKPCPKCDGSMDNHDPECPMAGNDEDDDMDEASCGKKMKKESFDEFLDSLTEEQLDEISKKLARKAAAASAAKSFEYGSSAHGPGTDKEAERLDKKADKARAHVQKRQGDKGVKKVDKKTGKLIYGESADLDTKSADKALTHDCAKHVTSEQWGFGECIAGQHTLVEQEDGSAIVTHYDVMFEHGIERDVPVEKLSVLMSESHKHTAKKKMKESVSESTVAQFEEEIETTYQQRSKGIRGALEQMWEAAVQAKQGGAGKPQETMKDKFKGKAAQDMAKDADMDNPEMTADDSKGHEDATKAGRVTKQAPTRGGEKRIGDKSIVNPVKGAVTSTTGKE